MNTVFVLSIKFFVFFYYYFFFFVVLDIYIIHPRNDFFYHIIQKQKRENNRKIMKFVVLTTSRTRVLEILVTFLVGKIVVHGFLCKWATKWFDSPHITLKSFYFVLIVVRWGKGMDFRPSSIFNFSYVLMVDGAAAADGVTSHFVLEFSDISAPSSPTWKLSELLSCNKNNIYR